MNEETKRGEWNKLKHSILLEMRELQCLGGDTGPYYLNDDETPLMSYRLLAQGLKVDKSRLQIEMKELRNSGLVELVPAVDQDYMPSGSGWTLTAEGVKLLNKIGEDGFPLDTI